MRNSSVCRLMHACGAASVRCWAGWVVQRWLITARLPPKRRSPRAFCYIFRCFVPFPPAVSAIKTSRGSRDIMPSAAPCSTQRRATQAASSVQGERIETARRADRATTPAGRRCVRSKSCGGSRIAWPGCEGRRRREEQHLGSSPDFYSPLLLLLLLLFMAAPSSMRGTLFISLATHSFQTLVET